MAMSRLTERRSVSRLMLSFLLPLGLALERGELLVPEPFEESLQLGEGLRAHAVETPGALAPFAHQAGLLEDGEVLRYRRAGDGEVRGNGAGRELVAADQLQDLPATRL